MTDRVAATLRNGAPRAAAAVGWCLLAMVVYLVVRREVDGAVELLLSAGLMMIAVGLARWGGASVPDLGVALDDVGAGVRWGVVFGLVVAAVIVLASWVPATEDFFGDERYTERDGGELAVDLLVRIPISIALFEELLFRGVLLGLLTIVAGRAFGVLASSTLFGLWHVFAGSDFADSNDGFGSAGTLTVVAATVLVTGLAGVGLAWLRVRSGSVLAPVLVHASANSTAVAVIAVSS